MKLLDFTVRPPVGRRFTLIPFGCVHFESDHHRRDIFDEFLAAACDPTVYTVGMGDYQDFARTTDRHAMRAAAINEDYHRDIDRMMNRQVRDIADYMKTRVSPRHWKQRCMGLVEGNHFWTYRNGTTTTQHLAELLDVPFLEEKAWIRVNVQPPAKNRNHVHSHTVKILVHHGYNLSGSSPALSLRRLETRVAPQFDADLILSSHAHQLGVVVFPVESLSKHNKLTLAYHDRVLAKTGAFYDGNCPNTLASYASKKLLPPVKLGFVRFHLEFAQMVHTRAPAAHTNNAWSLRIKHEY